MRIPPVSDPFGHLPTELSVGVLKHLDDADLDRCMAVSRGWHALAGTTDIWRSRLQRLVGPAWPGLPVPNGYRSLYKTARNVAVRDVSLERTITTGQPGIDKIWMCGRSMILGSKNRIQTYDVHTLELSQDWAIDGRAFYADEDIVVGGEYGPLTIWDARTHACLHRLATSAFSIPSVCRTGNYLVVGHGLGDVSVWNVERGTLERKWQVARFGAMSMAIDNDCLVVHDGASKISFWNWRTGERLDLLGDADLYVPTRCKSTLLMRNNLLIAMSNLELRAWEMSSGNKVASLPVPFSPERYGLSRPQWVGDTVACLGDGGIVFWDLARKTFKVHRWPNVENLVDMKIVGDTLFVATKEGQLQVWKFSEAGDII